MKPNEYVKHEQLGKGAYTEGVGPYRGILGMSKNRVINGNFSIWQRGTSGLNLNAYSADRWLTQLQGYVSGGSTLERGTHTVGQTDVDGNPRYFLRFQNASLVTDGSGLIFAEQRVEGVSSLSGQTVTFSAWVRSDTATKVSLAYNQEFGSGGSSAVTGNIAQITTVSTGWSRISGTVTLPSTSGKTIGTNDHVDFRFIIVDKTGFGGQVIPDLSGSSYFDISNCQLEVGTQATEFEHEHISTTLAKCQRYAWAVGGSNNYPLSIGHATSTTRGQIIMPFPVEMRVTPTFSVSSAGNFDLYDTGGGAQAVTAMSLAVGFVSHALLNVDVASGLTAGNATQLRHDNSGGADSLLFDAEL